MEEKVYSLSLSVNYKFTQDIWNYAEIVVELSTYPTKG